MANLRSEVLRCFKKLHRTRKMVFQDDYQALTVAVRGIIDEIFSLGVRSAKRGLLQAKKVVTRKKINEEFHKNKNVSQPDVVRELLKFSLEVDKELRATVVQAKEVVPGTFELRITNETNKLNNVPYSDYEGDLPVSEVKCGGSRK